MGITNGEIDNLQSDAKILSARASSVPIAEASPTALVAIAFALTAISGQLDNLILLIEEIANKQGK